ncbi:hypothetical protein V520_15050 [Pseudomonas putida KG-4]|nr:hypothetical protein V520_15050 [Pseudomonas putida KG-4]
MHHRPQGQPRRHQQQRVAKNYPEGHRRRVGQQDHQRQHLRRGFPLAKVGHRYMRPGAQLGHPLAQRRHHDLAADDHRGRQGQPEVGVGLHQQHQGHRHHQLVGHRVEEGTERRALLQSTRQVAVQPVGGGGNGEHTAGGHVAPVVRHIEQQYEDRDEQDA